ncbi:MAG: RNA polymerase sigma factor [Maricaulaceae bacterium]
MSGILEAFLENQAAIRRIIARRFSRAEDIEELTQETFLKCFAAECRSEIFDPKAFLLRAAKNLALSEVKKKVHTTTDYAEDSGGSDVFEDEGHVSAEARIDSRRKLAALSEAIASLPPHCRRALLMRKMENLKFKQIAMRLNVSVSTVQKRVAHALALCDAYLRAKGYEPVEFGREVGSSKPVGGSKAAVVALGGPRSREVESRDVQGASDE